MLMLMYFVIILIVFIYSLLNLDNMDKIKEWFNLNKTILLIAVAIILLIGLFIFGFMWGKTNAELKAANEKEKIIKTENKHLKDEIDSLKFVVEEKYNQALQREQQAFDNIKEADKIHKSTKTIKDETKKQMDVIANADADSLHRVFSRESESYIQQDK